MAVLFIVFHVVEKIVTGLICVALILSVSLIPYFAFRRVSREIGPHRMREMLLGQAAR